MLYTVPRRVSYDPRAIIIDGQRTLLLSGAIHYPRSTPAMWHDLFSRSKQAGLNVIETYVFWHLHEVEQGQYDFTGRLDLRHFCELAQHYGLYVILRIGPYICAEINYGGLPAWLRQIPGIQLRTNNQPFKAEVERWVRYLCDYMQPCFASQGGPIILAQMENEYNLVAANYGDEGQQYLQWSADLGESLKLDIPLIMCYGAAEGPIETMNSNTAHELIDDYRQRHPDQPALWTENWPGWYDVYGNPHHTRSAEHVAYAVARFVAAGGTGVNYYMWHGGTNFAREAMFLQTTSYDYDAPLDEYGFPTSKFHHLSALHHILREHQTLLLQQESPQLTRLGEQTVAYSYQDEWTTLTFLCNDQGSTVSVAWQDQSYSIPAQAVLLIVNGEVVFNSATIGTQHKIERTYHPLQALRVNKHWQEPRGEVATHVSPVRHSTPVEQLHLTHDHSDYCWYVTTLNVAQPGRGTLRIEGTGDISYLFVDGERIAISPLYLHERRGPFTSEIFTQSFELDLTGGEHQLAILCCAVGMIKGDWMIGDLNMVLERKGIWGSVDWNGQVIEGSWSMLPGLHGEHAQRYALAQQGLSWQELTTSEVAPLTWLQSHFTRPETEGRALAVDLSGLNKGLIWLNGHCLGRYWLLPIWERDEMGQPTGQEHPKEDVTQRYYHLPIEWLQEENTLTILEEMGGDVAQVRLTEGRYTSGV